MIAVRNPVGEVGIKPTRKHRKIIKIKNRAISIKTAQDRLGTRSPFNPAKAGTHKKQTSFI